MIIKRIILTSIGVILAAFLIVFIIANRQMVPLTLAPFRANSGNFTYHAPLFIWLLIFFAIGITLGSLINWLSYHKCKRALKKSKGEIEKLKTSIANLV
ncbi:LapA family protein [Bartonella massiliensis]|uniref:LapA family protein n=1 Tax=Bartonella massiliensis TaxID=929795 RepID=UPI001159C856|nr:LapA family protein [Bartonella massiliensis]